MKILLLLILLGGTPYYHVPQWFDTKLTGKCADYEGATFCYLASVDTSDRKMIGIGYKEYFKHDFDSLFTVWNDTTIYYLSIEDFVR